MPCVTERPDTLLSRHSTNLDTGKAASISPVARSKNQPLWLELLYLMLQVTTEKALSNPSPLSVII